MADHLGGTQAPLGFPRVPHRLPLAPPDFPRLLSALQASPGFPRLLKASLGFSRLPRLPQASQASPGFPRLPKASQGFPRLPKAPQASPGFPRLPQASPSFPRLPLVPSGSSTPGFPGSSWLLLAPPRAPFTTCACACFADVPPQHHAFAGAAGGPTPSSGSPRGCSVGPPGFPRPLAPSGLPWLPQASPGSLRPPLAPSGLPWLPSFTRLTRASPAQFSPRLSQVSWSPWWM